MSADADRRTSHSDERRARAAMRDALPAVVVLILLQVSLELVDPDGGASIANLIWCLLPLLPVLWLVRAQVLGLRRADEFQRVLQLESMAVGFGAAMTLALTGGLLDAAGIGDPRQSLQVTFIGGMVAWLTALAIKSRRAR